MRATLPAAFARRPTFTHQAFHHERNHSMKTTLLAAAIFCGVAASVAHADALPISAPGVDTTPYTLTLASTPPETPPSASANPFAAGRWALSLTGGYSASFNSRRRENIGFVAPGLAYSLFDNFQIVAETPGYFFSQSGPDTGGGGLNLLVRYHFLHWNQFTLFAEGGAGFILSPDQVPTGGTYFNFIPQGGVGLTYRLTDDLFLIAGTRVDHISNGGIRGSAHNPSMNMGLEGYAGVMMTF
jgi:opacity protein-like surface antigen